MTFSNEDFAKLNITVLAGGVGAARFLSGLQAVMPPENISTVVNTGDDEIFFGLYVSPDIDIVTYTLAGMIHQRFGWGIENDTYNCLRALGRFGHPTWFNLGDRDLATHIHRTLRMREGYTLEQISDEIRTALNVKIKIIPMTNQRVRTVIDNGKELLSFQEYFVQRRAKDPVQQINYEGIEEAVPAPGAFKALETADAVIIAPSNPFVSIGTILAVPGFRETLVNMKTPVAAISPIIGGKAVKGPAAGMMANLGHEVSVKGVASLYRDIIDVMIVDKQDTHFLKDIEKLGIRTAAADTLMNTDNKKRDLARFVLETVG